MTATTADYYATVRVVATALRLWRKGEMAKVNETLAGLPQGLYVGSSMTLNEAAFAMLASLAGKDFDTMVEAVVAEVIGLESEEGTV